MERPAEFNMAAYVLAQADAIPGKTALQVVGGEPMSLTYADLAQSVRGIAAGLRTQDLPTGTRVLLRLSNTPLFPICYLAAIAAGFVPIPTSPGLTTREADAVAAITKPSLTLQDKSVSPPSAPGKVLWRADLEQMRFLPPAPYDTGDPERPAYIVFTSGTGGTPRAVVHAHRAVLARRYMFEGWYGLRSDDRLMHAGAFNWTYTMGTGLVDPWTVGATALIPTPETKPEDLPQLMAAHYVSIFAAAPGVYRKMLRSAFPAMPRMRHGLSAGEKLPDVTRRRWEAATGTQIHEAYGMSECSTFISSCPARPAPAGTLGFPQDGRKIRIGTSGMIEIHKTDPGLMLHYLDAPDATAKKFDGQWFQTGDRGALTPDGAVTYLGRQDDMMNAGGVRVSPIEVEDALALCAPTQDWACAEVQISRDVSIIAAFHAGPDVIEQEKITADLAPLIAPYKIPRLFVPVASLPRGANNKLLRRKLRADWEARHGQA